MVPGIIHRYDFAVQNLAELRTQAEITVAGKIVQTTGLGVKHLEKAIQYELRRSALQHHVLVAVWKGGRAGAGWKSDADFSQIVQSVAREWVGAQTKGVRGDTPTEDIVVSSALYELIDIPGGQVDRMFEVIKNYL